MYSLEFENISTDDDNDAMSYIFMLLVCYNIFNQIFIDRQKKKREKAEMNG